MGGSFAFWWSGRVRAWQLTSIERAQADLAVIRGNWEDFGPPNLETNTQLAEDLFNISMRLHEWWVTVHVSPLSPADRAALRLMARLMQQIRRIIERRARAGASR